MKFETVTWTTYTTAINDYGETRKTVQSTSQIPLHYRIYSTEYINDPRYTDVDLIGLTKVGVEEGDTITINNVVYNVLTCIPSRYNVLMLKKR